MPGPVRRAPVAESAGISTISVAERSGYSAVPMAKRSTGCSASHVPSAKAAASAATSGAPVWKVIHPRSASVS
jgi:hypothetical protein